MTALDKQRVTRRLWVTSVVVALIVGLSGCAASSPSPSPESAAPSTEPPSPSLEASVQPSGPVAYAAQVTNRAAPTVEPIGRTQLIFLPTITSYPDPGSVVRLVGHFDDPAATTCHVVPSTEFEWSQPAVQLLCREQFVVTEFEVLDHMDLEPAG
jgi:hypothetical protein